MSSAPPASRSVLAQVIEVARRHLDLEDASVLDQPESRLLPLRLVEDLGLDSVQLLTLAVEVENHFGLALDEFDPAVSESVGEALVPPPTLAEPPLAQDDTAIATLADLVRLIEIKSTALPAGTES